MALIEHQSIAAAADDQNRLACRLGFDSKKNFNFRNHHESSALFFSRCLLLKYISRHCRCFQFLPVVASTSTATCPSSTLLMGTHLHQAGHPVAAVAVMVDRATATEQQRFPATSN